MVTAAQLEQFEQDGILKLESAFSRDEAARMCSVVWDELARRYGVERDDPGTWDRHNPMALAIAKRHPAFAPLFGPALTGALDALLGPGQWVPPKHYGQVLTTMPTETPWRVPHKLWHSDFLYTLPVDRLRGVKYWALLDDVDPGGAGTPQLVGSHRLMERYLATRPPGDLEYKSVRDGFMRSHSWLKELISASDDPDRTRRFMEDGAEIDGIALKVVECTGRAGDIYVTHPWVMHSIASNATPRPRLMRSNAVSRQGDRSTIEHA